MRTSAIERILGRAGQPGQECWIWPGSPGSHGYGEVREGRRTLLVHRTIFQHFNGPLPTRIRVCHTCDNRMCFNPAHLFAGDNGVNMQDMYDKGRGDTTRFPAHQHRQEILAKLQNGRTLASVAREFGVSYQAISKLRKRHLDHA